MKRPSPAVHTEDNSCKIVEGGQNERVLGSDERRKRVNNKGLDANAVSPRTEEEANSIRESRRRDMPPAAETSGSNCGIRVALRNVSNAARRRLSAGGCVSICIVDEECADIDTEAAVESAVAINLRVVAAAVVA
jgi:hypothetical protein